MLIYILHAHRTDYEHHFIEVFTTMGDLLAYLRNHPEVCKKEITAHECDPK